MKLKINVFIVGFLICIIFYSCEWRKNINPSNSNIKSTSFVVRK